jgi:isopentenyl diphosphate isomerase/L-lactate dehydrogenase-like FMN-dependent dehydrogenase
VSRRRALGALSAFFAGSPLLAAQQDPRPLRDHRRIAGFDEMVTAFDFEPLMHGNVTQSVYDYTAHGAGSEWTLRRNRSVFDWVELVRRQPVEAASVSTSTRILGLDLAYPIFVAPTAAQRPLHPDGEAAMHVGATEAAGTPMIISNAASLPVEKITAAAKGPTWFQFYPRPGLDASRDVLEQAQAAGCGAVVVTVDQQATAYERSLHNRNLGGAPRSSGRPASKARNPYRVPDGRLWYDWKYLEQIRPFIKVPILVKGILTSEDADMCVKIGMSGIVVSNHGGRSMDYGPSTHEVLPEIVDAVRGRAVVLIDSGFRRGSDVFKALALGADAACFGRATRWGLGAFGAPGVRRVLEIVQAELRAAMAQAGTSTLASLDRSAVRTRFS